MQVRGIPVVVPKAPPAAGQGGEVAGPPEALGMTPSSTTATTKGALVPVAVLGLLKRLEYYHQHRDRGSQRRPPILMLVLTSRLLATNTRRRRSSEGL